MFRTNFICSLLFFVAVPCFVRAAAGPVSAEGRLTISVEGDSAVEKMEFTVAVPGTISGRQEITALKMSPKPTRQFKQDGNTYAVFTLTAPIRKREIVVDVKGMLYAGSVDAVETGANSKWLEKSGKWAKWLKAEKFLEVDDPQIQKTATKLKGKTEMETLTRINEYVSNSLEKGPFSGADVGALKALEVGQGDCTDFTDVLITLCRACGIPARNASGYLTYIPSDTPKHDRMEAYLKGLGWVRVDPFHTKLGICTLRDSKPNMFVVDHLRTNDTLGGYHFWRYLYWGEGKVKVSSTWTVNGESSAPSKAITGK
ncbi:MAG: transglutaminase family protein [Verrucomicrobiaceae bacterium]|nr:transglutaminase family protein [Verrucomicrobiaceae bacterium]